MQYQDQKFFALKFLNHFTNAARFSVQLRVRAPAFRGVSFVRNQKESCRTPGRTGARAHRDAARTGQSPMTAQRAVSQEASAPTSLAVRPNDARACRSWSRRLCSLLRFGMRCFQSRGSDAVAP